MCSSFAHAAERAQSFLSGKAASASALPPTTVSTARPYPQTKVAKLHSLHFDVISRTMTWTVKLEYKVAYVTLRDELEFTSDCFTCLKCQINGWVTQSTVIVVLPFMGVWQCTVCYDGTMKPTILSKSRVSAVTKYIW